MRAIIIYLIPVLIVLSCLETKAQTSVYDSLKYAIEEQSTDTARIDLSLNLIWDYSRSDPEVSITLLKDLEALFTIKDINYKYDVLIYYYGVINKNLGQYPESESYIKAYKNLATDSLKIAAANLVLSNLKREQSDWIEVINYAEDAIQIFERAGDTANHITSLMNIGFSLSQVDLPLDAIEYHREALQLAIASQDTVHQSIAHSNLGLSFQALELLDSVEHHLVRAYRISKITDDHWGLSEDMRNLANLYLLQNRNNEALEYALQSHQYALNIKDPSNISQSKITIGNYYFKLNEYDIGMKWLNEVILDSVLSITPESRIAAHKAISKAHRKKGLYESALHHQDQAILLEQEFNSAEINAKVKGLEFKYQLAEREKELQLLGLQKEHTDSKLSAAHRQVIGLGVISLIILGLFLCMYFLYAKTKKQQLEINKSLGEKNTLLKEIHHRVKNNLQVVSSLLNLQSKHVEDQNSKMVLKEGQNRVRSMALLHQNLYQNDSLLAVGVKAYFEKIINNLFNSYGTDPDRIKLDLAIEEMMLDVDTLIPMGLILNELITNSLKHAFKDAEDGVITVSLKEVSGQLHFSVKDNGVGMKSKGQSKDDFAFGSRLINTFSKQLEAELEIKNGKGTSVNLVINDYKITHV